MCVCIHVRECRLPIRNVEQTNEIREVGAVAVWEVRLGTHCDSCNRQLQARGLTGSSYTPHAIPSTLKSLINSAVRKSWKISYR